MEKVGTRFIRKAVSAIAALSMILSLGIVGASAASMRISDGADIAGYVMLGAKTKLEVNGAPSGTAKIRWYTGLSSRDKVLVGEVEGSTGTILLDVQNSKKYIFAEALDADGNILEQTDRSVRYGVEFKETQSIFNVTFDDGFKWNGTQYLQNASGADYRHAAGGRISVSMGNPGDVNDPLNNNNKCMMLTAGGDLNYIEAASERVDYAYETDGKSIYVLEADMQFKDLTDRGLIKVTCQDAGHVAAGSADGRDSEPIMLSNGSFNFYGNTIKAETDKWYNVKYVYDAAHKQLTALIDNVYLGTAAGVDMTKLGRLSLVNSNNGVMYLDNLKWTKYEPAVQLSLSGSALAAAAADDLVPSIWRSLDGDTFYKYADGTSAEVQTLPYAQFFVARGYKDGGFTQSERIDVAAATDISAKRTYLDCDFGDGYEVSGDSLNKNGEKVFSLSGTNTLENGELKQAVPSTALHEIVTSMGDLKGTDSGVVTIEADIRNADWRNEYFMTVRFLKNLSGWDYNHDLYMHAEGGDGIIIYYTDQNGDAKSVKTGIKYSSNESKHYKLDIDVDKQQVTVTIDGQSFVISDIAPIRFVNYLQFHANMKVQMIDNVQIYKYETQTIEHRAEIAEKHYLLSSAGEVDIANGSSVILEVTNDGSEKSFTLFAAAYNEDGSLAEVGKRAVNLGANGAGTYSFRFSKEYAPENVKVFSWDAALTSVLPIAEFN